MINQQISKLKKLFELSLTLSGDPIDIFKQTAKMIGELLEVKIVCLSEIEGKQLNFLAIYLDGEIYCNAGSCPLAVTPCATVEETKDFRVYDHVQERFPEATFLKDHNAFAYCGFPSLDNLGNVVAITCLLDDKAHDFTEEDHELLRIFGQRIGMEIERKRNIEANERINAALKINQERLNQVVHLSATGVLDYNHRSDSFYCSPELRAIFGWDANEEVTAREFTACVHREDQQRFLDAVQLSINPDGNGLCEIEYRIVRRNGEIRWLTTQSQTFFAQEGKFYQAVRCVGAVQDITEKKLAELEQRLFATAFQTREGIMIADVNFLIVRVNQAFTYITGYSMQEALGNKPSMLKSGRHDAVFFSELDKTLETDGYWQGEIWDRHKDGHIFPKWMTITAVRDEQGDITHYVAIFSDISEHKAMEAAFWENENKLVTILDSVDASIFIKNSSYQYLYANQQVRQLFGKENKDIIGKSNECFFDALTTARMHAADSRVIEQGERMAYEETIPVGDDRIDTTYFTVKQPLRRKDGSIYGLCGISTDISERKQMEEMLRESHSFNISILNSLTSQIAMLDSQGVILAVNNAWTDFSERNSFPEACRNRLGDNYLAACKDNVNPLLCDQGNAAYSGISKVLSGELASFNLEYPCHGENRRHWFKMTVSPLKGPRYGVVVCHENITERKQAETKLNAIFNAAAEGIISFDRFNIIASVNAAVEQIFGYKPEELIGCNIRKLKLSKLPHPFSTENPGRIQEVEGHRKNGSVVPLDISRAEYSIDNQPYFTIIVRDISLRKHREELDKMHLAELAHVTRLGLMAEMASGIAHEINQPLAAINSYTRASLNIIKAGNTDPVKLSDILEKTQQQAMRAGQIIHRMREFLKSNSTPRATVEINTIINDAVSLCMDEIKKNSIHLSFDLQNNLPPVFADHIQIEQVLINLIRNSIDVLQSIPETQPRQLSIHSQQTTTKEIQIRVKDNGAGIDGDKQPKILMPFYTTKTDGMGMGLSICRSLMESHGGSLRFKSQSGKGSSFYLTLPVNTNL